MPDSNTESPIGDAPTVEMTQDPLGTPRGQHPYWQDLNPDFLAGSNYGDRGPHPEKTLVHSAYDVKGAHRALDGIEDDDLKQIPIMPTGSRLEQGAIYLDLRTDRPTEFTATGDMEVGEGNWYVPKAEVPYWLWNRLIGVTEPQRLDRSGGNA